MKIGRYIIGLISGLTFGMLFAPKKGKNLRKEIITKGSESGQDALMALANAFKDAGADVISEVKKLSEHEQVGAALKMSKEKMHEYLASIEETGYEVAATAQEKLGKLTSKCMEKCDEAVEAADSVQKSVKKGVKKVSKAAKSVKRKAVKAKAVAKKAVKSAKKKSPIKFAKKSIKSTSKRK